MHTNTDILESIQPRGMKINRMVGAIMSCRVESSTVVVNTIGVSYRSLRKRPHPIYTIQWKYIGHRHDFVFGSGVGQALVVMATSNPQDPRRSLLGLVERVARAASAGQVRLVECHTKQGTRTYLLLQRGASGPRWPPRHHHVNNTLQPSGILRTLKHSIFVFPSGRHLINVGTSVLRYRSTPSQSTEPNHNPAQKDHPPARPRNLSVFVNFVSRIPCH